jgi:outer membrane lipoprotein SlyB
MKRTLKRCSIVGILLLVGACAGGSLKPTDPGREQARKMQDATPAVVIDVIDVTLKAPTTTAQATGAAIGGYMGNQAARDQDTVVRTAATVGGAAAGSVAGNVVANTMDRSGTELVLQTAAGRVFTVVQQADSRSKFAIGDSVWVVGSGNNVRVLPAAGTPQQAVNR